jgi:ABC-type phosphate/phosphonate transport system substrate-binding protein
LVGLLTIDFLRIRDAVPLEPALSYSINGHVGSQFILVVPKERVSGGLSSLRNKKILIHKSDETGIIPISWLNSLLRKQGLLTTDRFFSSVKMVDKASQAGLPVYLYQADCSVITDDGFETLRLLNPDLGEKLVVLERSSYLLVGMVAYRSDLPGNVKKEIKEIAVRLASYPKGNQILTLFKIGAFCDFQSSDLDSLLELMREDKGILSASKTKILQQSP